MFILKTNQGSSQNAQKWKPTPAGIQQNKSESQMKLFLLILHSLLPSFFKCPHFFLKYASRHMGVTAALLLDNIHIIVIVDWWFNKPISNVWEKFNREILLSIYAGKNKSISILLYLNKNSESFVWTEGCYTLAAPSL